MTTITAITIIATITTITTITNKHKQTHNQAMRHPCTATSNHTMPLSAHTSLRSAVPCACTLPEQRRRNRLHRHRPSRHAQRHATCLRAAFDRMDSRVHTQLLRRELPYDSPRHASATKQSPCIHHTYIEPLARPHERARKASYATKYNTCNHTT